MKLHWSICLVLAAGVALGDVAKAPLSDQDRIAQTRGNLDKMREFLNQVLKLLEQARDEKDVVKRNCVNEKLTQVKGLVKVSEEAELELKEAAAKREEDAADHEFTKVAIAHQKVEQLRAEAEQCIGQLAYYTDKDYVIEVEIPPDLPSADPTNPPAPDTISSRPPAASSIQ